jgi:serine/threonine protein kinase
LKRIESGAIPPAIRAVIPPTALFIAHDADPDIFQLSFADPDFSPMFDRWRRLRKSGITVDFQRILRFPPSPFHFNDYKLDLSAYEEGEVIRQNARVFSQIYLRRIDEVMTVVKAISVSGSIERRQIEPEIENLLNLCHPMIARLIGCTLSMNSTEQRELKTVRLYAAEGSLADVLSNPPGSWTPTAKAKAVVGIALGLRFAHGLGLLHGAVKASNILFDADRRIQIPSDVPSIGAGFDCRLRCFGHSDLDRTAIFLTAPVDFSRAVAPAMAPAPRQPRAKPRSSICRQLRRARKSVRWGPSGRLLWRLH